MQAVAKTSPYIRKPVSTKRMMADVLIGLLPILAFTSVLQQKWVGSITGVWIYSAALFLMTIVLCTVYIRKASQFDVEAAKVIAEFQQGGK